MRTVSIETENKREEENGRVIGSERNKVSWCRLVATCDKCIYVGLRKIWSVFNISSACRVKWVHNTVFISLWQVLLFRFDCAIAWLCYCNWVAFYGNKIVYYQWWRWLYNHSRALIKRTRTKKNRRDFSLEMFSGLIIHLLLHFKTNSAKKHFNLNPQINYVCMGAKARQYYFQIDVT